MHDNMTHIVDIIRPSLPRRLDHVEPLGTHTRKTDRDKTQLHNNDLQPKDDGRLHNDFDERQDGSIAFDKGRGPNGIRDNLSGNAKIQLGIHGKSATRITALRRP